MLTLLIALLAYAPTAQAETITRPITIIVPYSPGVTDQQIRVLAPVLQRLAGQTVIVENRTGAGGAIGARAVASAPPDGATLLYAAPAVITVLPLMQKTPYAFQDFTPLARVTSNPHILAIRAGAPFATLPEMIAYGRANPGKIRFGSSGTGTAVHLAEEAFIRAAGIETLHVPFRGLNDAITQTLAGNIDFIIGLPIAILPLAKAGKLKALAQFGATRSPLAPDVPTLREQGVALTLAVDIGLFGPRNMPPATVATIDRILAEAMQSPEFKAYTATGTASGDYLDAPAYTRIVEADRTLQQTLIDTLGLAPP